MLSLLSSAKLSKIIPNPVLAYSDTDYSDNLATVALGRHHKRVNLSRYLVTPKDVTVSEEVATQYHNHYNREGIYRSGNAVASSSPPRTSCRGDSRGCAVAPWRTWPRAGCPGRCTCSCFQPRPSRERVWSPQPASYIHVFEHIV